MTLHREIHFEDEICADLAATGWLHAEGDAATYDRTRALFPADVLDWVQATQPAAWAALAKGLAALCVERGFKADPSVTTDTARVLRPLGSLHPNGSRVAILKSTCSRPHTPHAVFLSAARA